MFKGECQRDKFKFNHDRPDDFTSCFWYKHRKIVLIWITYRFSLIIYFFCVLSCLIFFRPEKDYVWYINAIYISTLSCLFEFLLFVLAFVITVARFVQKKKRPRLPPLDLMPWHYKTLWFWYNLTASNALVVTISYWLILYRPDVDTSIMFLLAGRLFNSVLLVIDYVLCSIPFRFLHIYVPCLFPAIYTIFTIIYQFSGGTGNAGAPTIYSIVDWEKNPLKAILFLLMYVTLCVFSHCGMCTIHFLKLWIKKSREDRA